MLRCVHRALDSLGVDALISIGGDDTLKTANKFKRFQDYLPADAKRITVVHVPKTIDNDYRGIDFTFGYFTAVEFLASEIRNLLADAEAGRMYFLVETMGRSAGWLAYGASIAGEASKVISVEDLDDELMTEETLTDPKSGHTTTRKVMDADKLIGQIVHVMLGASRKARNSARSCWPRAWPSTCPRAISRGPSSTSTGTCRYPRPSWPRASRRRWRPSTSGRPAASGA